MEIRKENRAIMYKSDTAEHGKPRFTLYANVEGKQVRVSLFANVGDDDQIYYAGPVNMEDKK